MKRLFISIPILLLSFQSFSQKPDFGNAAEIEKWMEANNIPVLGIGLIRQGKINQVNIYGSLEKGKPAPNNTIFNVASLTKPVTAMVTLQLVSKGEWNLDEPLYAYFTDEDIADDPRHMLLTTRHVLSHQTGFSNWRWLNKDQKLAFNFDPGKGYGYSGEGMEYLRKALEKKFNKSLQALAAELIFQPLKMVDTRFIWDDNVDSSRYALNYNKDGQLYETVKNKTPNAADDLLTSVEDYCKFLVAVMHGEGLSKSIFEEMKSHQVASLRGKHFGLGFEIYNLKHGKYALSHGGSDNGVKTIFFIFPESGKGLVIFTNSDTGANVYIDLVTHYLGTQGKEIIEIETAE